MINQPMNVVVPELPALVRVENIKDGMNLWGRCCANDDLYDAVIELHGLELNWEEW